MSVPISDIKAKAFIIIPVYNESTILPIVLKKLLDNGYNNIIIVDDGSVDNLENKIKPFPLYYVKHKINLGQGASLQTGFEIAKKLNAEYVVTFDADDQHDILDIENLLVQFITTESDIILGSRFMQANKSTPFIKILTLQSARIINFIFTGLLLSDAHNGLRALNQKALAAIHLTENRMAHATEILFELKEKKLAFKEVPVTIRYTHYSIQKGQKVRHGIKILIDLILYKLKK